MRRDGYYAGRLSLWLDLRTTSWSRARPLPAVLDDHACLAALGDLWDEARGALRGRRVEILRVGVTLSELSSAHKRQLDLFLNDDPLRRRCETITHMIDGLNRKFGKRVLTLGPWTPPPGGYAGGKIAYNRIPSAEDFW